jgi:hypothetical protein
VFVAGYHIGCFYFESKLGQYVVDLVLTVSKWSKSKLLMVTGSSEVFGEEFSAFFKSTIKVWSLTYSGS